MIGKTRAELLDEYASTIGEGISRSRSALLIPMMFRAELPLNKKIDFQQLTSISGRNRGALHELLGISEWIPWGSSQSPNFPFILGKSTKITLPRNIYAVISGSDRYSDEPVSGYTPTVQIKSNIIDPGFSDEVITEYKLPISSGHPLKLNPYMRIGLSELLY